MKNKIRIYFDLAFNTLAYSLDGVSVFIPDDNNVASNWFKSARPAYDTNRFEYVGDM